MEKLLKLSNGNYFFIQDFSEGGWDYYYLDGNTHKAIDGGLLETDRDEWDTPITDDVIREVIDFCANGTKYEQELSKVSWEEETELDFFEDFED